MNMKVLIISVITENLNMEVLPLGAAFVAAAVRTAGHEVEMLSVRTSEADYLAGMENRIKAFGPEVIGISLRNIDDQTMMNTRFLVDPVKEVVQACRKISHAVVVLGGAGYSIFPESALAFTGADMGIKGEGEKAFVCLLERLANKKDVHDVPGLFLPVKGMQTPPDFPRTLDNYTMPLPFVHLDIPKTTGDTPLWFPIQTRRGCPMECSYCSTSAIEGRHLRKYAPEKVVENIRQYVNAGIDHFYFVDNTFNFPVSYAEALCDRIIAEKLRIKSRCIIYPRRVTETLADKMAQAGFREVSLGFESGCERILKAFNKRFSLDEVRRISRMFKDRNIFQMGFLLLGGPGETRESVLESLKFVEDLSLDFVKVSVGIRIYPDTPLAELARAEGKVAAGNDLFYPTFYVRDEIRDWLYETVTRWVKEKPNRMM